MGSEEPTRKSDTYELRTRIIKKQKDNRRSNYFELFNNHREEENFSSSDLDSDLDIKLNSTFNELSIVDLDSSESNTEHYQSFTMAQSKFNMKECNDFIPDFGSDPKVSLDNFITRSNMMHDVLEVDDKLKFFNFILCKLNGEAYDVYRFNSATIKNWDDLKKQLNLKFKPIKSVISLKTDLFHCIQERDESVRHFADRVQNLLSVLNNSYIDSLGTKDSVIIIKDNNSTALNTFCRGIKNSYIRTLLLASKYELLSEAILRALEEESYLNLPSTSKNHNKNSISNQPNNFSNKDTACQICNKIGHYANRCFKRFDRSETDNKNVRRYSNHSSVNHVSSNKPVCKYCNKSGHSIDFCYKRIAVEQKKSNVNKNNNDVKNFQNSENSSRSENQKSGTPFRISK